MAKISIEKFIEKYGTMGAGILINDAANEVERGSPLCKELRQLARDLTEALTAYKEH